MISRDKTNPSLRYMFPVKSSLAPDGMAIGFTFDRKCGLTWVGRCDVDRSQMKDGDIDDSKKALATRVIRELLAESDAHSADILKKLKIMGVSERTINTAKKELNIISYRKDGAWYWHLQDQFEPSSGRRQ